MKKCQKNIFVAVISFFSGTVCLLTVACSPIPQEPAVKTSYYHAYGPQITEEDWQSRGSTGEVVEVFKTGVEVRREYSGGVLHGISSWTFPHMKVIERIERYNHGIRVLASRNYENGSPKFQEEWFPDKIYVTRAWYEDGSPRIIEEYRNMRLFSGQYFTVDGEEEASVVAGNGIKVERSRRGELLNQEHVVASEIVTIESYYLNGQLREIVAYRDGKRHGRTKRYSESGEPLSIEQWTSGLVDGQQLFFENGKIIRKLSYVMGKKDGLEVHYRSGTEEVIEEIAWWNNFRHGQTKIYLSDQILREWYWRGGKVSEEQFLARSSGDLVVSAHHNVPT